LFLQKQNSQLPCLNKKNSFFRLLAIQGYMDVLGVLGSVKNLYLLPYFSFVIAEGIDPSLWNRGWLPPPFPFIFASFTASFCKPIGKGNKCKRKRLYILSERPQKQLGPILHAVHLFRSHALYIHRALLSPIKAPRKFCKIFHISRHIESLTHVWSI
jgi:hypothetical protein